MRIEGVSRYKVLRPHARRTHTISHLPLAPASTEVRLLGSPSKTSPSKMGAWRVEVTGPGGAHCPVGGLEGESRSAWVFTRSGFCSYIKSDLSSPLPLLIPPRIGPYPSIPGEPTELFTLSPPSFLAGPG